MTLVRAYTVRDKEHSMNPTIVSSSPSSVQPVGADASVTKPSFMASRTTNSRLIGALFLLGFLSYGIGFALVTSVTSAPNFLATISAQKNLQTVLTIGAFLMLLNSLVDVGKGVLFFPILEKHGQRTALAYLAAMIIEVVLLAIGVLSLLLIVPLAQQGVDAGLAKALGSLALQSNTTAYQIAEMALGLGGIFLCSLLFRTRLIPPWLAGWGVIGYAILAAGTIAEIFGIHIGLALSIPGGLFELALGVWLLIKGFAPKAFGQAS
jgi:uncharacterized membrane protein